jgi:hypothetical protein
MPLAKVHQEYMQYLDGPGGAYCMIEQQEAVPLPPPYLVSVTTGPVMQEVVQSYAYGHGLQQRVSQRLPVTESI